MAQVLVWVSLALVLVVVVLAAITSYRRHARRAQARSRAALNRLLAEADEIAQRGPAGSGPGTEATNPTPDA